MRLITLILGLAIGFGGGVYWGVHHPTQASGLASEEERQFLELQLKTSQAIKQKLDQLAAKQQSQPGKSFVGSGFVSGNAVPAPDPEISAALSQQDQQIQQLQQHLNQLK